jgi:hypothetical protein
VSSRVYAVGQTREKVRGKCFAFQLLGIVTTVAGRLTSAQPETFLLSGPEHSDRL